MDACRDGSGCWRPLCPYGHSGGRAARWAALRHFLATQEEAGENLEEIKVISEERTPEDTVEQTVEHAESGGAGSSWFGKEDTTSTAFAAVAKSDSEAQPPGIEKYGTTSADATAVAKQSVGETRPPGTSKHSASTGSETAAFSGEARPLGIANHSVSTTSALAVSPGKLGPFGPEETPQPVPTPQQQQSQSMLMKVGHLGLRSAAPRQSSSSQSVPDEESSAESEPGLTRLIQDALRLLESSPLRAASLG